MEFYQQQWIKVDYHPQLAFRFLFTVSPGSEVRGLTFIHTSSGHDLHELLYRKFKIDPNVCFTFDGYLWHLLKSGWLLPSF